MKGLRCCKPLQNCSFGGKDDGDFRSLGILMSGEENSPSSFLRFIDLGGWGLSNLSF